MNGYLRIKNTDLYERDGVTYWRNGGNIIGNVVKAVIEENDVITSETYYIESLKTAKPIMLDPDVKIGGLTASESKNGNFIIVETAPADFTEYGGGAGLKITFIYGVNYYSIETVESNGDIKIYDPDGDAGTLIPDALPDVTDATAGDALILDADKKPTWGAIPNELPTIASGDAGKVLKVNAGETGTEWGSASKIYNNHIGSNTTGWKFHCEAITSKRIDTYADFAGFLYEMNAISITQAYVAIGLDPDNKQVIGVYSGNGTEITVVLFDGTTVTTVNRPALTFKGVALN